MNQTIIDLAYQIALLTENFNNAQQQLEQLKQENVELKQQLENK